MRERVAAIIRRARAHRQRALSEYDSKRVIAAYGVPTTREVLVATAREATAAARRIGYPVALKVCSADVSHKTERGLLAVGLHGAREVRLAFATLRARAGGDSGGQFLVQEMVEGRRELMIGMVRDPQFGPCVMFGLGGVFTEVLRDVVFRVAPLRESDARAMLRGIRAHRMLEAVRGMPALDAVALCRSLVAIGRVGLDHPEIVAIDVNPLIARGRAAVAVDALVVLSPEAV